MKRCPKCNASYFDNMLEFCLEDGTRLYASEAAAVETQRNVATETFHRHAGPLAAEKPSEETIVMEKEKDSPATISTNAAPSREDAVALLTFAPIVLALLHNWWQWVYLEKVYIYSWADYLLSANFLMWLLLLASGAAAGIYSVKRPVNRVAGAIGLVTLAINLILFLVPRR